MEQQNNSSNFLRLDLVFVTKETRFGRLADFIPTLTYVILGVLNIVLYLAYYLRIKWTHWKRLGVPCLELGLCLENSKDIILQNVPVGLLFKRIYNQLEGHKFAGYYRLIKPSIMLRDPELIRTVFVKNFSNFHDRFPAGMADDKMDPLASHLVNLTGQRWRNIRYKLAPTFSSSKLRKMNTLLKGCIRELDEYLMEATNENCGTGNVVDMRELMARFMTDVIATCAYGCRSNSVRGEDSEFRRIGRLAFKSSFREQIRDTLRMIHPRLISLMKVQQHDPEVYKFFKSVLQQAVKDRESKAEKRHDFLQLMIDMQAEERAQLQDEKSTKTSSDILFTDNIVSSNAFQFFTAGFETTAGTLSHCLYELALNPEICEKMKDEAESVRHAHNGELNFNALRELVYTETVISETLRKYPPLTVTGRTCTESFQMPDSSVVIEKGASVNISIYGLHHDPKYFPEPDKFLPERFSKENKESIVPGSFLPFGDGPRICIGMQLARFEMLSVLSHLVSNYTFHPCEKTITPLKFNPQIVLLTPLGGIWLRVQKRIQS